MVEKPLNICVGPVGAWGRAFAGIVAENGHNVAEFHHDSTDLKQIVSVADIIVLVPPSRYFRSLARLVLPNIGENSRILILTKGLEKETNLRNSQILEELKPGISDRVGVLSGPNLSSEIEDGHWTSAHIASSNVETLKLLDEAIDVPHRFSLVPTTDVPGVEFGGAAKGTDAFYAGMIEGVGWGEGTIASILPGALKEMTMLGVRNGAIATTFMGPSGLADLRASCGDKSRNFRAGRDFAKGDITLEELLYPENTLEGVNCAQPIFELAEKKGVEMPIIQAVHRVLYEKWDTKEALLEGFQRSADLVAA